MHFLRDIDSIGQVKEYAVGLLVRLKTALPSRTRGSRVIRVNRKELEEFARGVHVGSTVYFSLNPLVRFINWKKLDSVFSLFSPWGRDRILDFGSGNGVMLPTMSDEFDTVVGIDLCTTAASRMSQAYRLRNVFLVAADGMELPFHDDSFDAVMATSTLEHFRDIEKAVAEIVRITKRGGLLFFLSPTENAFYRFGRWLFRYKKPVDHYHSAKDIEGVLEKYYTVELKRNFPSAFLPFLSIYRLGRFRVK